MVCLGKIVKQTTKPLHSIIHVHANQYKYAESPIRAFLIYVLW